MSSQQPKVPSHTLTSPPLVESGTTTPPHATGKRGTSKRKQTLLSLLDALNELADDEEAFPKGELPPTFCTRVWIDVPAVLESNVQPSFQDDRDVREWLYRAACRSKRGRELNTCIATVDEYLQTIGAESFARFER